MDLVIISLLLVVRKCLVAGDVSVTTYDADENKRTQDCPSDPLSGRQFDLTSKDHGSSDYAGCKCQIDPVPDTRPGNRPEPCPTVYIGDDPNLEIDGSKFNPSGRICQVYAYKHPELPSTCQTSTAPSGTFYISIEKMRYRIGNQAGVELPQGTTGFELYFRSSKQVTKWNITCRPLGSPEGKDKNDDGFLASSMLMTTTKDEYDDGNDDDNDDDEPGSPLAMILGVLLGLMTVVLIVLLVVFFLRRRKYKREDAASSSRRSDPEGPADQDRDLAVTRTDSVMSGLYNRIRESRMIRSLSQAGRRPRAENAQNHGATGDVVQHEPLDTKDSMATYYEIPEIDGDARSKDQETGEVHIDNRDSTRRVNEAAATTTTASAAAAALSDGYERPAARGQYELEQRPYTALTTAVTDGQYVGLRMQQVPPQVPSEVSMVENDAYCNSDDDDVDNSAIRDRSNTRVLQASEVDMVDNEVYHSSGDEDTVDDNATKNTSRRGVLQKQASVDMVDNDAYHSSGDEGQETHGPAAGVSPGGDVQMVENSVYHSSDDDDEV